MFLTGLGTATPPNRYMQTECWDALIASEFLPTLNSRSQAILRKVLRGNNGICSRFLAFDGLQEAFEITPDALDARFAKHAPAVASRAGRRALADADISARDIDAVIVSTCTGYLCPGLSSYVSELLELRHDVLALDLVGQGCGAALPNLRTAEALVASGRASHVLSICVEICSAAFYLDDDPGVLISACLFGDGAGAAVLSRKAVPQRRSIEWKSFASLVNPEERNALLFETRSGMLRNILTRPVPRLAAEHAEQVLQTVLDATGLKRGDITAWIMHAGGRDVLEALQRRLQLDERDLRYSADMLHQYGNMSSAFVYFVLQAALADDAAPGWWWMSAFGAGFSCHGALLKAA
jgi:3,5-dihydroxyphenylacetyl-CoA synthase